MLLCTACLQFFIILDWNYEFSSIITIIWIQIMFLTIYYTRTCRLEWYKHNSIYIAVVSVFLAALNIFYSYLCVIIGSYNMLCLSKNKYNSIIWNWILSKYSWRPPRKSGSTLEITKARIVHYAIIQTPQ